jgi:hypothetical protein
MLPPTWATKKPTRTAPVIATINFFPIEDCQNRFIAFVRAFICGLFKQYATHLQGDGVENPEKFTLFCHFELLSLRRYFGSSLRSKIWLQKATAPR